MYLVPLYIERVGGSDNFWQNPLVAANNILTIIAMGFFFISACNLLYDNVRNEMEQRNIVEGVGAPDGKLDLFELYTCLSVFSIMVALAIRVYVNATDFPVIVDSAILSNSTSSVRQCSEFSFTAAKLTGLDKAYLKSVFYLDRTYM